MYACFFLAFSFFFPLPLQASFACGSKKKKHFLQSQTVRKIGWLDWLDWFLVGWCMGVIISGVHARIVLAFYHLLGSISSVVWIIPNYSINLVLVCCLSYFSPHSSPTERAPGKAICS